MRADPNRTEADEVPWFTVPPPAVLFWQLADDGARLILEGGNAPAPHDLGHLHFWDPLGERAAIPVTTGASYDRGTEGSPYRSPIWHITEFPDLYVVSPSVHFIGYWHSPRPVSFRRVESLPYEDGPPPR